MGTFLDLLILIAGFAALIKGADALVDGSAGLARNFRVPELIIGLTIVAMGTSAPELAVSTTAAIQSANEIALSNVMGSNMFNLLMVLGICAILCPVPVGSGVLKKDFPVSLFPLAVLFLVLGGGALFGGSLMKAGMWDVAATVTRPMGLALLAVFAAYMVSLFYSAKKNRTEEDDTDEKHFTTRKCVLLILIGIALVIVGGEAVVYSARRIAAALGMTETLIGLTVVALGTSLPELVTSIVAARKGETDLAVGNVVGSNIFNLLLILGISSTIHPVTVNVASMWDMLILIAVTVMTWIFGITGKKIDRREGIVMVLCYVGTVIFAAVR